MNAKAKQPDDFFQLAADLTRALYGEPYSIYPLTEGDRESLYFEQRDEAMGEEEECLMLRRQAD